MSITVSPSVVVGDEEEWEQQCVWHSDLMSGLDKVDVCMDQLQREQETWTTQTAGRSANLYSTVRAEAS